MTWPVAARFADGSCYVYDTIDKVPLDKCVELTGPALEGSATVKVDPSKGERALRWQTQIISLSPERETASIPTFAIEKNGEKVAFLYFEPDGGIVLSSKELQWP